MNLEVSKVVQVEEHCGNEDQQEADCPQIGVLSLVIFEHDHALTVAQFVLFKNFGVVLWDLLVFIFLFFLLKVHTVLFSIFVVLLIDSFDTEQDLFFFLICVKSNDNSNESGQENQECAEEGCE